MLKVSFSGTFWTDGAAVKSMGATHAAAFDWVLCAL